MSTCRTLLCWTAALAAVGAPVTAQEEAPPAAELSIVAVRVEPSNPGPDTLCRLEVTLANHGDHEASQLGFSVSLNGQSLAVYDNQLFMYAVPPGDELAIPLYNFWTTETSRPELPPDGKITVEVSLLEAQWMDISMEKEMVERAGQQVEEDVEVWTPLGAVPHLPVSVNVVLAPRGT